MLGLHSYLQMALLDGQPAIPVHLWATRVFSDATSVSCVLIGLASLPRASWTINRSYPSYCCKTVLIGQPSLYLLKIGYSYDSLNKEFGKVDSIGLESALAYTPRQQVIVFAHLIQLDVKILLVSMM